MSGEFGQAGTIAALHALILRQRTDPRLLTTTEIIDQCELLLATDPSLNLRILIETAAAVELMHRFRQVGVHEDLTRSCVLAAHAARLISGIVEPSPALSTARATLTRLHDELGTELQIG